MNWYETNARVLPWRTNPEPYWVWGVGDHASADQGGSGQTVFCPVYGDFSPDSGSGGWQKMMC